MNKQITLSAFNDELAQVRTKKKEFLAQMDRIIPWGEWKALIQPYYYKGERGNKPYELELMLRLFILQNLYNLADEGTVAEVIDSRAFSEFCGVDSSNQVPDGDTLGRFRNLLMKHGLQQQLFAQVVTMLMERGLILKKGTIVDSTINNLGVHLIFENNSIDTRTKFSEMVLTILAAFAQEESRSISENTIWGIRKRYEEGEVRWNPLYGYEKNEQGEYQIVPDEAAVVQLVYNLYEHGSTIGEIRKELAARKIRSPKGAETWTQAAVQCMLVNERYAGDIRLQKYYVEDFRTHKPVKNNCTMIPSYYVGDHHRPIVSKKQFQRVQAILGMRKGKTAQGDEDNGACNQYPLADKLRCPFCGSPLYQRTVNVQTKHSAGWHCERGDNPCGGFVIRSAFVETALLGAYNSLDTAAVESRLDNPSLSKAAKTMLAVKKQNPSFARVDYWWVDELVDHIEFGNHTVLPTETMRMKASGREFEDDRTMKVFWKCGMVSVVASGIVRDCDQPQYVAALVNEQNVRKTARMVKEAVAV